MQPNFTSFHLRLFTSEIMTALFFNFLWERLTLTSVSIEIRKLRHVQSNSTPSIFQVICINLIYNIVYNIIADFWIITHTCCYSAMLGLVGGFNFVIWLKWSVKQLPGQNCPNINNYFSHQQTRLPAGHTRRQSENCLQFSTFQLRTREAR